MELRHLRYFMAVAEELHFGRAAARLGISQPPLSRQIRDLEEELGVRLLIRNNRSVRLSGPGERFLKEARKVLSAAEEAVHTVRRAARGELGRLDLGTLHSAHMGILSRVLPCFRRRLPEAEVRLHTMDNREQAEALHRGILDAGLVFLPFDGKGLEIETVLDDPLVLALPSRHRFRKVRSITMRDLDGEPYLFFRRDRAPAFHDFTMEVFRKAGIRLTMAMEVDSLPMALGMVAAGMGVALVPSTVRDIRLKGVAYREFAEPIRSGGLAVARRCEPPGPVLAAFLEAVEETFGNGGGAGRAGRKRRRPAAARGAGRQEPRPTQADPSP